MLSPVNLAMLRARWASVLGSFVAVVLGVVMLTMAGLLLTSAQPQVPQRFSAAPIVVQSPDPVTSADLFLPRRPFSPAQAQRLVAELSALPGVAAAIPDMPFYAQLLVNGRPADPVEGNSWPTAALAGETLSAGRPPAGDTEVALPAHAPGDRVTFLTAQGLRDYTVTGTVKGKGQYFHHFSPVRAIALLTGGPVDLAQVQRVVAGQGKVLTGDARSALEPPGDARTRWIGLQVLTAMAALSGFVAVFLVASTFSFSVLQRTRELGLLRLVGATPRQVRRLMLGEAATVGALAGACGVPLGAAAAPLLGKVLVEGGFEPATFSVRYGALPMLLAFLTGLLVAVTGAALASRRAARVRPLAALRAADAERRPMTRSRWITGLGAATLGALFAYATASADALSMPTYAIGAVMAFVTATALLCPAFVPALARLLLTPWRAGALGLLVRQSAAVNARRTASTAAPVMLAVAFTVLVTGMVQTGAQAYTARRAAAAPGTATLVPDGTPGLSAATVDALDSGTLGTNPLGSLMATTVWLGEVPIPALGLAGPASRALADDEITVSRATATQHGWAAGSAVTLTVASGQSLAVRVAAVDDDAPAGIVMSRTTAQRHDPDALTQAVYLSSAAGLAAPPGAKLVTAEQFAALADAQEDRLVWTFTLVLVGMAGGFTVIAVANTLLMSTLARRRELHALGRVGATRRQLLGLITLETTFVVAIGVVMGCLTALPGLLAIRAGLAAQIGLPVPLAMSWPALIAVIAACLTGALLAATAPATRRFTTAHRT